MTLSLYWKIKTPAKKHLPYSFKRAVEQGGYRDRIPPLDFIRGFRMNFPTMVDNDEGDALDELIKAMQDGKEIEFEWK